MRQHKRAWPWQPWLVGAALLGTMTYAIAEELTLLTMYPSPRGVYKELRAGTLALDPPGNLDVLGSLAVGPNVDPHNAGQVLIENALGIGIGNAAPGAVLDVRGSPGQPIASFDGSAVTSYFDEQGYLTVGRNPNDPNDRQAINNTLDLRGGLCLGNPVFCQTSAPAFSAIVEGKMAIGLTDPGVSKFVVRGESGLSRVFQAEQSGGTPALMVTETGNVGIGTSTEPTDRLEVNGKLKLNGDMAVVNGNVNVDVNSTLKVTGHATLPIYTATENAAPGTSTEVWCQANDQVIGGGCRRTGVFGNGDEMFTCGPITSGNKEGWTGGWFGNDPGKITVYCLDTN